MKKIYLSPSNQPANKYIVGNTNEKSQMEAVAAKVQNLLTDYDVGVKMATLSMGINKSERPTEAKNNGCDFYFAIHSNAGSSSASGAVGFYHPNGTKAKDFATALVKELNAVCPIKSNRSTSVASGMTQFNGAGYGEIRSPMELGIPSVLLEVDFHDNPKTAQWIIDSKDTIAAAIVKAIVDVFGLKKKTATTTPPAPPTTTPITFTPYLVKVTADTLNIRKGPGTNYGTNGAIKDKGVYTIVEESNGTGATKWGKLKSGAGWISLDYVTKTGQSGTAATPTTTTAKKSVDELAKEVIKGLWGNNPDRKNRLTAAGYNYSEVQARVNQLLK